VNEPRTYWRYSPQAQVHGLWRKKSQNWSSKPQHRISIDTYPTIAFSRSGGPISHPA